MYAGIDIGGTKCACCIGEEIDNDIRFHYKEKFMTAGKKPYDVLDILINYIKQSEYKIESVGISCGGPLDSKRGIIMSPANLPGWDNIEAVSYVEDKLGVKCYMTNDANACAIAEWKYGAGIGTENMIFLTFGTGMGAGLILNGKLYSGTNDNAGEIGHIRMADDGPIGFGKYGSFEGFCSGNGLARLGKIVASKYEERNEAVGFDVKTATAKSIAEAAYKGDKCAIEVYDKCAEKLGYMLSALIDCLNPEMIVIGSVYERSSDLLRDKCMEIIKKEALDMSADVCSVVPARLGDLIGDYAAISVATGI